MLFRTSHILRCVSAIVAVATQSSRAAANPAGYDTSRVGPANANCQRQTYQLNVTSKNIVFNDVDPNANATYLTALTTTAVAAMGNITDTIQRNGMQQVTNTYSLSGTLCTPKNGTTNTSQVQLLLHGVGFDASYWDFTTNGSDTYSYVSAAAAAGWTTFRYDRLGTGLSDHPADTYNVVQAPTDLAIATEFASMLRNGQIGGTPFSRIAGVGHSYGSVQVQGITATAPQLLDAAILTGFSNNATGMSPFLSGGAYAPAMQVAGNRYRGNNFPNGYIQNGLVEGVQTDFFYFPGFEEAALTRAFEVIQPVTQGVLFTLGSLTQPATNFTGPVQVVTGAKDIPFCFGNCYGVPENSSFPSIPATAQALYPAARNFSVHIPENTGHGLNSHLSAPQTYQEIMQFLADAFPS